MWLRRPPRPANAEAAPGSLPAGQPRLTFPARPPPGPPPADSTLLVTGSADKNIKIWGLDFGDCHRSLFAHADSVMAVAFVPNTHYVFTAGGWAAARAGGGGRLPRVHAGLACGPAVA